jgi:hypothetical protein
MQCNTTKDAEISLSAYFLLSENLPVFAGILVSSYPYLLGENDRLSRFFHLMRP